MEVLDTPAATVEELDAEIRGLLARVMRSPACRWSRAQIADLMSRRIDPCCELGPGQPVSFHQINSYTAKHRRGSGKSLRFPAAFVPMFCEITENFELMRLIVGPHLDKLRELDKKRKSEQQEKRGK